MFLAEQGANTPPQPSSSLLIIYLAFSLLLFSAHSQSGHGLSDNYVGHERFFFFFSNLGFLGIGVLFMGVVICCNRYPFPSYFFLGGGSVM